MSNIKYYGSRNLYEVSQLFPMSEVVKENNTKILTDFPYTYRVENNKILSVHIREIENKRFIKFTNNHEYTFNNKTIKIEKDKYYLLEDIIKDIDINNNNLIYDSIEVIENSNYIKEEDNYYNLYKCIVEDKKLGTLYSLGVVEKSYCLIM